MQLISENSEASLARRRAMDTVDWALRDLTANLLRVIRGAGKPYEIGRQAQALVDTMVEYREAVGHFPPSHELASLLSTGRDPEFMERIGDEYRGEIYAQQAVIRGALQIVTSRMLGQRTQESVGENEMYDGATRLLEELRTER